MLLRRSICENFNSKIQIFLCNPVEHHNENCRQSLFCLQLLFKSVQFRFPSKHYSQTIQETGFPQETIFLRKETFRTHLENSITCIKLLWFRRRYTLVQGRAALYEAICFELAAESSFEISLKRTSFLNICIRNFKQEI